MHNKPTVPPKPSRVPPVLPQPAHPPSQDIVQPVPAPTTAFVKRNNRGRGNSVSFADQTSDHEISDDDEDDNDELNRNEEAVSLADDDDDDDDDDEVIDFDSNHDETRTAMQRSDSIPPPRPHTMTDSYTNMRMVDTRPRSLTTSHHHQHRGSSIAPVDVLAESIVDACILVPAQTNTGDSLAPPTATQTTDYVPNIPVPPLLTTHRRLQDQLDDLEASLSECKSRKRALAFANEKSSDSKLLDSELNDKILQRTAAVAETRETLNRVRTLYMSAATVPNVMQFPPHLVAYQLTLIEFAIFRDIPPDALLTHSPRTPHQKVVASTDFFNYITRAIEHSILLPQEASRRAEIINRWIKVATKCLSLSNYQTLKAIVSALGTPPVQRLRRTWDCIPKKRMGRLDLLNALMSESENYGRYREHMGLETKRRWLKPVVPFLGVFIHDMTYLLAAVKGQAQGDSRVQDVVMLLHNFHKAPSYPQRPPASYVKASRKHSFGPSVLTNALHRTSSSKNRMSNSSALFGVDVDGDQGIEVEQQLITQYLLMRPWVSEKIIDELSVLREPPKQRATSTSPASYGRSNSANSGTGTNNSSTNSISNSIHTSSILSNASSLVRLSSSYSTNTSSMTSWEDQDDNGKRSTGFWPFRKSSEMTRPTTLQSDVYDQRDSWSDDEDDPPPLRESSTPPKSGESISSRTVSTTSKILTGHARSFSLPSARPSSLSDQYSSRKRT
ncbi:ras guanine nucleotide exchange factor domain-containing protein [Fennellomyces sp. T-0311]|nr:ras guanine nucleotide exchange factor domain-containing protein [Fennellomyces sp. T-0311]